MKINFQLILFLIIGILITYCIYEDYKKEISCIKQGKVYLGRECYSPVILP